MAALPNTIGAIFDLESTFDYHYGMHFTGSQRVGEQGLLIGEEPFDPSRNYLDQADPMSIQAELTGVPYVPKVLPYNRLAMNVMLYASREPTLPDFMSKIRTDKHQLVANLANSITEAKQLGDQARLFVLGQVVDYQGLVSPSGIASETPKDAISDIAHQFGEGSINFIVSDFTDLTPDDVARIRPTNTIAVKANVPLDLELPAGVGVIPFGGTKECDTDNSKELKRANQELRASHLNIMSQLQEFGLSPVHVVYDSSQPGSFDASAVDYQLASTVRQFA